MMNMYWSYSMLLLYIEFKFDIAGDCMGYPELEYYVSHLDDVTVKRFLTRPRNFILKNKAAFEARSCKNPRSRDSTEKLTQPS